MYGSRIHYGTYGTAAQSETASRFKTTHHGHHHYAYENPAVRASARAAAPIRSSTPVRSTTPNRATSSLVSSSRHSTAAAPHTPVKQMMTTSHTAAAYAATERRQAAAPKPQQPAAASSSAFMTQAARGGPSTPRHQISRGADESHAHTAPLRRGPSLLPSTPLQERQLLVLDMDETLLHADVSPVQHDVSFVVHMDNGTSTPVYVKFRPHLNRFLSVVSRLFEVVVFTASISRYANQVLDYIDPSGSLVHHRLYRQHCTETNGTYVKDLERLGRSLERVSIVDNSPVAYSFHPENAIAIPSWYDCDRDTALHALLPHLERMARRSHVYDSLDDIRRELRWE